ncbi:MAG TPA: DinB family protein [Bryobacteraceae bacterium]|nr:DinB family protein [Bryobacteraceae bacterium]
MTSSTTHQEPWLRGAVPGVHPVVGAVLHAFQHATEDLEKWTEGLTDEQVWEKHGDIAPLGFQIRHIGGAVDRLMTYALGEQLSVAQFSELSREKEPGEPLAGLFIRLRKNFSQAETALRGIDPAALEEERAIGRSRLVTTLGALLVHIAEHTQRHVGEAIVTTKVLRAAKR